MHSMSSICLCCCQIAHIHERVHASNKWAFMVESVLILNVYTIIFFRANIVHSLSKPKCEVLLCVCFHDRLYLLFDSFKFLVIEKWIFIEFVGRV